MTWAMALVVVAGIIAVIIAAGGDDTSAQGSTEQTAFAETVGSPLPRFDTPDPAIGLTAPTLSAQNSEGDRVQVGADGTARLIGFFAHWCPHCQDELPRTVAWLDANPLPAGVEVVAISTAVDPTADNYPPMDWFARENWPSTVLLDDESSPLAAGFGLTAFPFWVAVDSDGQVVQRVTGSLTEQQFESLLQEISPSS